MKCIKNKVAVVTGGSEGIGLGIAKALSQEGAIVAIIARSKKKLQAAAKSISGEIYCFPSDLTDTDATESVMRQIATKLGPIDILINNVGGGTFKPYQEQSCNEAILPVHLPFASAITATHTVIPSMIERKSGHIVNMTSPAGYIPFPNMMPYVASRHGIVGLSLSLHEELKQHGIGSTLFCPGQVNTGYFDHNDADMSWYPRVSKIFRVLEPDEVAIQVIKAIRKNKREIIYPLSLGLFVRTYQKIPRLSIGFLKACNLWQPSHKSH